MDLKDFYIRLQETSISLLKTIEGLVEEKISFKNRQEDWSVLEILEHIYLTDKIIFTLVSAPTEKRSENNEIIGVENLEEIVIGKNFQKVQAPDVVYPKGLIHSVEEFKTIFLEQRKQLQSKIELGKIIVDNRIFKHPYLGEMTIEDWLNLMVFHTQRHIQQIESKI